MFKNILLNKNDKEIIPKGSILAYGHFTTIHAGHIRYLKHAKKLGEKLTIALLDDGNDPHSPKYSFNQKERAEALSLISIPDFIYLMNNMKMSTKLKVLNKSKQTSKKSISN